jgi:hypothetical protein
MSTYTPLTKATLKQLQEELKAERKREILEAKSRSTRGSSSTNKQKNILPLSEDKSTPMKPPMTHQLINSFNRQLSATTSSTNPSKNIPTKTFPKTSSRPEDPTMLKKNDRQHPTTTHMKSPKIEAVIGRNWVDSINKTAAKMGNFAASKQQRELAEMSLIYKAQTDSPPDVKIRAKRALYQDKFGLFRCDSSIDEPDASKNDRGLIYLPKSHRVTAQIVKGFHTRNHHLCIVSIHEKLSHNYWISKSDVKAALRNCPKCRSSDTKLSYEESPNIIPKGQTAPVKAPRDPVEELRKIHEEILRLTARANEVVAEILGSSELNPQVKHEIPYEELVKKKIPRSPPPEEVYSSRPSEFIHKSDKTSATSPSSKSTPQLQQHPSIIPTNSYGHSLYSSRNSIRHVNTHLPSKMKNYASTRLNHMMCAQQNQLYQQVYAVLHDENPESFRESSHRKSRQIKPNRLVWHRSSMNSVKVSS